VWALYEALLPALGPTSALVEWDNNMPTLARLLEERVRTEGREGAALPSLLQDDDADVFAPEDAPASVSFDAEEDLDIPDFLKS